MPQWIQNLSTAVMYLVMVAVGTAVLRAIYQSVKNAGKAFSEDEEDEVLFLHQGNDERENLPWRREKKEGYLSRICVSAGSIKNDQKSRKIPADRSRNPGGAGREKRAFRRRHETAARRL